MLRVGVACIAALAVAGCGRLRFDEIRGDAARPMCVAEACNGIDDDCDGLVDEGCPCTPFDVILPGDYGRTVTSLGDGYALQHGTRNLAVIDDNGALVTDIDLAMMDGQITQQIAWTGTQLAAIDDGNARIVVVERDGTNVRAGADLAGMTTGQLRWNGRGLDVGFGQTDGSLVRYAVAKLDRDGQLISPIIADAPGSFVYPIALTEVGDRTAAFWLRDTQTAATVADPPNAVVPTIASVFPIAHSAGGSSDGTRAMCACEFDLLVFDGQQITEPPNTFGMMTAAAWTGQSWVMAVETGVGFDAIQLDNQFVMIGTLATIPPPGASFGLNAPVVIADARRSLLVLSYVVSPNPPETHLIQTCF